MADKVKISALPAGTPIDTDIIPYVDLTTWETKKALKSELKWDQWDAATLDVWSTTTWNPWTDADVVNSGTTSEAIFDFTIPRWDVWATWDQWIQWEQGIQGIQWDKWDTWDTGAKWDTWDTWPQWDPWVMQTVVWWTNITVDASDPANPIVNSDLNPVDIETQTFDLTPSDTTHTDWRLRWNVDEHTVDLDSDLWDTTIQLWQELVITFYNDTGSSIPIWTAVIVRWLNWTIPTVELALADNIDNIEWNIFITAMETGIWAEWLMSKFGKIHGVNTSTWDVWDALYVSDTNAWELTNVHPIFPNYSIRTAQVVTSAESWVIWVNQTEFVSDTFNDAFDWAFRESFEFTVTSTWGTITGSLANSDWINDLTTIFSDWLITLDTTPALTIELTAWTSTVPQSNYVYIPKDTRVLTLSTSTFPSDEHIKVAYIVLLDATTTEDDWALRNNNWNDHLKFINNNWHINHITERLRQLPAKWDSWAEWSSTVNWASDVDVAVTSWVVYQMHKQVFPAINTATTWDVHIVNDFTAPYKTVTNLWLETDDALWNTLNNSSFSFVMWGIQNLTWETSHIMINLPTWQYSKNSPDEAVSDANNYSVYSIPSIFNGSGFLIARFTYTLDAGWTTWVLYDTEDLRGSIPNTTAGWWAGWVWVTDFTGLNDTPSSYIWEGLKLAQINVWETALEFTDVPTISNENITEATDKNYVTDAEAVIIWNTSWTNTWDQIISDATITTTDITTNNVSTSKHWFAPKGSWVATEFLNGNGTYSEPAWGGGSFNLKYPHWIDWNMTNVWVIVSSTVSYTVPTWKTLYITYGMGIALDIDNYLLVWWLRIQYLYSQDWDWHKGIWQPMMVAAGEVVSAVDKALHLAWFLVDENASIEPIYTNWAYTVPTWKKYIILQVQRASTTTYDFLIIWGVTLQSMWYLWQRSTDTSMNVLHEPIILDSWDEVLTWCNHFWYLVPDDFSI